MTKVANLFLWSSLVCSVAAAGESMLQPEWTKPKQVGDKVPDVTFATRVRIESDDENPFAWKRTYQAVSFSFPGNVCNGWRLERVCGSHFSRF
jgi:hypothetical protein